MHDPTVLDIRDGSSTHPDALRDALLAGLTAPTNEKVVPTVLLYDETGLRIYDRLTTEADEYYLFACEEEILQAASSKIIQLVRPHPQLFPRTVVVELGAGALRKTSHLLRALGASVMPNDVSAASPPIMYFALDLEQRELDRTITLTRSQMVDELEGKVSTRGLLGTYNDGIEFIRSGALDRLCADADDSGYTTPDSSSTPPLSSPASEDSSRRTSGFASSLPLFLMFLGSSLGNFTPEEAIAFLKSLPLRPGSADKLLIGLDHDNPAAIVEPAYNDRHGLTKDFILNGLKCAGRTLGDDKLLESGTWSYVNFYNTLERRHEAYYRSRKDQKFEFRMPDGTKSEISFLKDELVRVEYSHKYSEEDTATLLSESNLRPIRRWRDGKQLYSLWLLERPPFYFPLVSPLSAKRPDSPFGSPSFAEWEETWKVWDMITLQMIPRSLLHEKPIDLRHKIIFYLGHIPTFLDIHLSNLLNEPATDPERYKTIFERGIDPNVDDPAICHNHSVVPESDNEWPLLEEVVDFRDRVRERLRNLYAEIEGEKRPMDLRTGRVLVMTMEHEQMHTETLLYMLLQIADGSSSGPGQPTGYSFPDWESICRDDQENYRAFEADHPSSTTILGPASIILGHQDCEADDNHNHFTSQHEFGWDNESPSRTVHVARFSIDLRPITNGQYHQFWVNSLNSTPSAIPKSWILTSGMEVRVRTLYGPVPLHQAFHWPVIATFDELSDYARAKGGRLPTEAELRLFFDTYCNGPVGASNTAFRNWHPMSSTVGSAENAGIGHNGGVWEWTSTKFLAHDGFSPSVLYPGYSADFFDGNHYVVLGGSYATLPRLAQRRSFRNWYQHNYPYAWISGRVVYDGAPE